MRFELLVLRVYKKKIAIEIVTEIYSYRDAPEEMVQIDIPDCNCAKWVPKLGSTPNNPASSTFKVRPRPGFIIALL